MGGGEVCIFVCEKFNKFSRNDLNMDTLKICVWKFKNLDLGFTFYVCSLTAIWLLLDMKVIDENKYVSYGVKQLITDTSSVACFSL